MTHANAEVSCRQGGCDDENKRAHGKDEREAEREALNLPDARLSGVQVHGHIPARPRRLSGRLGVDRRRPSALTRRAGA